jgi:hypothetical protein
MRWTITPWLAAKWLPVLPISWACAEKLRFTPTIGILQGLPTVTLPASAPHLQGAYIEHTLTLEPGGSVSFRSSITAVQDLAAARVQMSLSIDRAERPTVVVPTPDGVIASDDVDWPDWTEPEDQRPERFAEGWLACQGAAGVCGLIWMDATTVEAGSAWRSTVTQGDEPLSAGSRRDFAPIAVYAGPGDWRMVRRLWRQRSAPDASRDVGPALAVLQATVSGLPRLLRPGRCLLTLRTLTGRRLAGMLPIDAPVGWCVEPRELHVATLTRDEPAILPLQVQHLAGGPRAARVSAHFRSASSEECVLDGACLDLGDDGDDLRSAEITLGDQLLLELDNGVLRLCLAPSYAGTAVALETMCDGVNHLLSSFPTPRPYGWLRPWFGGVFATLCGTEWEYAGDHGGRDKQRFAVDAVDIPRVDGFARRGWELRPEAETADSPGVHLRTAYTLLPRSPVLAIRTTVRNAGRVPATAYAALTAYLQPDGEVAQAELLTDIAVGERGLLRARRTRSVHADSWVAVRHECSGRTVALIGAPGGADRRVLGMDWGIHGANAALQARFRLDPGEERSVLGFLVVADSEHEARAYHVLSDAAARGVLP